MTKKQAKMQVDKPLQQRPTIEFDELMRLSTINSKKLPNVVEIHGRRIRWVGIGWVDECEADGTETLVI